MPPRQGGRIDKDKLTAMLDRSGPKLMVFDAKDAGDPRYKAAFRGKRPPTLREKMQEYGGAKGKERGPGGDEHEVDLTPHIEQAVNPDTTYVIVRWHLADLDDLRGLPKDQAVAEARRRLGID